jgi:hypothetical protein
VARKRQRPRPPPAADYDLKRPVITGIVQAVAREIVVIVFHWRHWGLLQPQPARTVLSLLPPRLRPQSSGGARFGY